ncbi:MAG: hypothetical protein K0S37_1152 [Microbacterium sp.]|jgi:hypothetical protein|nr:hypothetical protein [Microbacterium sp.]
MTAPTPPDSSPVDAGYHPPLFPLFEAVIEGGEADVSRGLLGWNGLVSEPATDVALVARAGTVSAVVVSARWPTETDARVSALSALSALAAHPVFVSAAEMIAHAEDDARWGPGSVEVDGRALPASTTVVGGITAAYGRHDDVHVAVAARDVVSVRTVQHDAVDAYPLDPFAAHAYGELDGVPVASALLHGSAGDAPSSHP